MFDPKLKEALGRVQKPGRYTGGEPGSVYKDKEKVDVRFAFCFPDTYEVGMSFLGEKILYELLNRRENWWCERAFMPWLDMKAEMERLNLPLYTMESKDPLTAFDAVGFTLQYELSYTNILAMLDLAGIPLHAAERTGLSPLVIAGGTDVLVQMREGKRAGKALISIQGCREMRGVSLDEEENLRIGSLTTFSHITADPLIQRYINVLGEAVDMVGGPQIRNIGTIGGNTCNGVTSADSASTLHAWEAIVELTGRSGIRRLPIKNFYIRAGQVDIRAEEGEIQTAIIIPKASYENCFGHYIKYAMRNAMDIATLGTSVNARLSPDKKTFERVRIAFGVAGPVPLRALNAEAFINGREVTLENIQQFGRTVLEDIHPRDSWRASKAFRSHIAVESAKRCLMESVKLAGGEL